MAKDNFFRIVVESQPNQEKGWLTTLRCGHKIKRDIQEMPGFGVWCAECEVEGSKNEKGKKNVSQAKRHTGSPERVGETPTTVHQEDSSESGAPSGEEGNRKPKNREKREKRAPASERMIKAKTENATFLFSKKDEFLAAIGSEVKLLEDANLGAAAFCLRCSDTELTLMYNPTCVDNLTDDQLYGIVGHEIGKAGGWCVLEAIKKGKIEPIGIKRGETENETV